MRFYPLLFFIICIFALFTSSFALFGQECTEDDLLVASTCESCVSLNNETGIYYGWCLQYGSRIKACCVNVEDFEHDCHQLYVGNAAQCSKARAAPATPLWVLLWATPLLAITIVLVRFVQTSD